MFANYKFAVLQNNIAKVVIGKIEKDMRDGTSNWNEIDGALAWIEDRITCGREYLKESWNGYENLG